MTERNAQERRQEAIKDLISKQKISDQKQLIKLLKESFDMESNQAVVSRDLRKLGVVKKERDNMFVYELPTSDTRAELLKLAIVDILHNEVMIVVKTHAGLAPFVGDCIDQLACPYLLGCLAGENVVFASPRSIKHISELYEDLCVKLYFKR